MILSNFNNGIDHFPDQKEIWFFLLLGAAFFSIVGFHRAFTKAKAFDCQFPCQVSLFLTFVSLVGGLLTGYSDRMLEISLLPGSIGVAGLVVSSRRFRK
jgi:hypothetical protein